MLIDRTGDGYVVWSERTAAWSQGSIRQDIALPVISLALASGDHQRIRSAWREMVMANRDKTGRIIGTVAAIGASRPARWAA